MGRTITSAVVSAIAEKVRVGEVGSNLLRCGPEIVQALWLIGKNVACRNEDIVDIDSLSRIRHPKRVVQCKRSFGICEAIQIPICLPQSVQFTKGLSAKLTCEDNIIGVFFVVAIATILKSQVIFPSVYVT